MALLIRGGQVLAGTPAALTRADVLIEGDRIAAVGPGLAAPAGAQVIDAAGHLELPGMGHAPTHAARTSKPRSSPRHSRTPWSRSRSM